MRLYSFTNFYLSSIQQGIQPAHCISDLFVKYADESAERAVLLDWATNHKTMICLNGGNAAGIREIYANLTALGGAIQLPFVKFHEDAQSLDGALTSCAIVIPQPIYDAAATLRTTKSAIDAVLQGVGGDLDENEMQLAYLLNEFGLAK
jgi:hypothetical protein